MRVFLLLSWLFNADAGVPPKPALAADRELVENLELLELMDETSDYELLEELSVER